MCLFLVQGCTIHVGMGAHTTGWDAPETRLANPVGVVRGEAQFKQFTLACEHHSGIFVTEEGGGYNLCQASLPLDVVWGNAKKLF